VRLNKSQFRGTIQFYAALLANQRVAVNHVTKGMKFISSYQKNAFRGVINNTLPILDNFIRSFK
jgi:hypothetical protein